MVGKHFGFTTVGDPRVFGFYVKFRLGQCAQGLVSFSLLAPCLHLHLISKVFYDRLDLFGGYLHHEQTMWGWGF